MTRQRPALSGALALILAMLSLAAAPAPSQPAPARVTALVGGRLIDGYGGRPLENSVVLISGERIQAVGTLEVGKYADVIAVRGDVLHHVDLLSNVDVVVKHGVRYK